MGQCAEAAAVVSKKRRRLSGQKGYTLLQKVAQVEDQYGRVVKEHGMLRLNGVKIVKSFRLISNVDTGDEAMRCKSEQRNQLCSVVLLKNSFFKFLSKKLVRPLCTRQSKRNFFTGRRSCSFYSATQKHCRSGIRSSHYCCDFVYISLNFVAHCYFSSKRTTMQLVI